MKMPLSLINSFLTHPLSANDAADTLSLLGLEVDAIHSCEGDAVLEISLTPNLGHCMSALGMARELAAATQQTLHYPSISSAARMATFNSTLEIVLADPSVCPCYCYCILQDVTIGPSPEWLQRILIHAGYRPIHWAVDALNYLMLKNGQPFHAFDFDRIEGKQIRIHPSPTPHAMLCLDETLREIPPGTLLISDAKKPIAIAGLIGSLESAVSATSKNLLIEAAYFDPATLRKISKQLSFRSESAHRFEKGIDPNRLEPNLQEAIDLLLSLSPTARITMGPKNLAPFPDKKILCRTARVNQILGTTLSQGEVEGILQRLQFGFCEKTLAVSIPFYRRDLLQEIDLIEEVAKIYGYNHIERKTPQVSLSPLSHDPFYLFEEQVRRCCIQEGLQEIISSNLIGAKLLSLIPQDAMPIAVLHPKSEEHSLLRPSLLPGGLQVVQRNLDHQTTSLHAFEIGTIYQMNEGAPQETLSGAIVLMGPLTPPHWSQKPSEPDFFDLKGLLENLFQALHVPLPSFQPSHYKTFHPGRQASLFLRNEQRVGCCGEIHPNHLTQLNIKKRVFFAEINLSLIYPLLLPTLQMKPLAHFPSSERDWTLSSTLPAAQLLQILQNEAPPLLETIQLIDLYQPQPNQCNLTFRCIYRDRFKTLSSEETDQAHEELMHKSLKTLANYTRQPLK